MSSWARIKPFRQQMLIININFGSIVICNTCVFELSVQSLVLSGLDAEIAAVSLETLGFASVPQIAGVEHYSVGLKKKHNNLGLI